MASGFVRPTVLVSAGDGSGRLFLAEQAGRVWVIQDGEVSQRPFLDITGRVLGGAGGGLLGLAFHPGYRRNGLFFAHYVNRDGHTTIGRFQVQSGNPDRARAASEVRAVVFAEPAGNHKGGDIAFGPDGFLYLTMGDASMGGDPDDNAQSLDRPFGKILRYDVGTLPAVAAPGNPFTGDPAARDEIWAYGLRNPWRLSFDSATGDLFVADVGERRAEEVNFQPASSDGGENYGWRRKEGSLCFEPAADCDDGTLTEPILEYRHELGCSVTGGYVYRGRQASTIAGHYVYGDFCSGVIWAATPNRDGEWISRRLASSGLSIVTFGRGDDGELYAVDFGAGSVHRLVGRELFASGFESGRFSGWKRRGPIEIASPGLAGSGYAASAPASGGERAAVRRKVGGSESQLETTFAIELSDLDLGGGEVELASWGDSRGAHLRLIASRLSRSRFSVELRALDANLGERRVGRFRIAANRTVWVAVEWGAATSPAAADGSARLFKNDRRRGTVADLATGDRVIQTIELGLPSGAPVGSGGAVIVDEVVVSN